jgi:hypothetical protein
LSGVPGAEGVDVVEVAVLGHVGFAEHEFLGWCAEYLDGAGEVVLAHGVGGGDGGGAGGGAEHVVGVGEAGGVGDDGFTVGNRLLGLAWGGVVFGVGGDDGAAGAGGGDEGGGEAGGFAFDLEAGVGEEVAERLAGPVLAQRRLGEAPDRIGYRRDARPRLIEPNECLTLLSIGVHASPRPAECHSEPVLEWILEWAELSNNGKTESTVER